MVDYRRKDVSWNVTDTTGRTLGWDGAKVAVLMDIRDELKKLNNLLSCGNFVAIPHILREISKHTLRPRPKRKAKPPRLKKGLVKKRLGLALTRANALGYKVSLSAVARLARVNRTSALTHLMKSETNSSGWEWRTS